MTDEPTCRITHASKEVYVEDELVVLDLRSIRFATPKSYPVRIGAEQPEPPLPVGPLGMIFIGGYTYEKALAAGRLRVQVQSTGTEAYVFDLDLKPVRALLPRITPCT